MVVLDKYFTPPALFVTLSANPAFLFISPLFFFWLLQKNPGKTNPPRNLPAILQKP